MEDGPLGSSINFMKILNLFNEYKLVNKTNSPPYIIAEAGVNHEGSMEIAKRLIYESAEAGANAIKFQTYKANTLAAKNSPHYWDLNSEPTTSQYDLFKKYDKFWKNECELLKKFCDEVDIEFLSTPFDIESADFLNDLMDALKISSSDLTNKPFIQHIAKFKKPIILSTGASYLYEIEEAVSWIEPFGNPLALLHCVLNYPTLDDNANLAGILKLKEKFPSNLIGYSDHTLPKEMKSLEVAYVLGACILEKHFTHDKSLRGNDHYHAMDKKDLKLFNNNIKHICELIGDKNKVDLSKQSLSRRNARRSLVSTRQIDAGSIISSSDLTFKRPAFGVSPKHFEKIIGMKARVDIDEDSIISWDMLQFSKVSK